MCFHVTHPHRHSSFDHEIRRLFLSIDSSSPAGSLPSKPNQPRRIRMSTPPNLKPRVVTDPHLHRSRRPPVASQDIRQTKEYKTAARRYAVSSSSPSPFFLSLHLLLLCLGHWYCQKWYFFFFFPH
ncbi:uncharacterized protein BJX67DRAFT_344959 [Aspergillus lucknowensis]|uniref:Uncharacterized protein n=1 Tax=Aspergillus lucknowensis TaxID=176173 RepID=A0ABR4M090_9EURO